jgi:hypothetical protein
MNRSYSKIRHIQESNERLERRVIKEQSEDNLVGKTIDVFTDKNLSQKFNSVKVTDSRVNGNSMVIKFNGISSGNDIIESMTIQCGSNMVTMEQVSIMMGGSSSKKTITGYVSQKLVDYLKPLICKSDDVKPSIPSDF